MHAQIKTFNLKLLQNFKNQYDGKKNIIGSGKVHFAF